MTDSCSQEIKHEREESRMRAQISLQQWDGLSWMEDACGAGCAGAVGSHGELWGAGVSVVLCFQPTAASPSCALHAWILTSLLIVLQNQGNDLKPSKGSSQQRHKGLFDLPLKGD